MTSSNLDLSSFVSFIFPIPPNKFLSKKNCGEYSSSSERFKIPFVISGGVSSIDDVYKVIKDKKKIEGIIIGKAIYENKIDLTELGKL